MSDFDRFMAKIAIRSDGCWEWLGSHIGSKEEYGKFVSGSRTDGSRKFHTCHRWIYEYLNGPVPEGKELDHLCRHRWCSNPDHVEAVTRSINAKRGKSGLKKLFCKHGHPLIDENIYVPKDGSRRCRLCRNFLSSVSKQRKRTGNSSQEDIVVTAA